MRAVKMGEKDLAFTTIELLLVIATLGVIAAMAVPSVVNSVRGYRLHSDLSTLASLCNVARLRAASQYAPYRVNVSVAAGTYSIEKLCGNTASSVDGNCTSAYAAFTTPDIESGTQYVLQGNTFASCRPSGPGSYPGTITADALGCPDPFHLYFNTRGAPVDSAGNPLTNGGAVIYMTNQNGMIDALAVSLGGEASVWNWDPSGSQWYSR
jgi:type II secretory pathway pseudopilin PulG